MGKIDTGLNALVATVYGRVVPSRGHSIVPEGTDLNEYYARTGFVPVVEAHDYPVFEDAETYYKFWAWYNWHRIKLDNAAVVFAKMAFDAIVVVGWSDDTQDGIDTIYGVVEAQRLYAEKYKKAPVDLRKFIKSYIRFGQDTVLSADRY